jgi:DNA-binding transcriptional LysR family regulator
MDVNLVVALDALLRERNVTRAAKRVGLSQPAMSHALMRLRETFNDQLLIRQGRHMALTERAAGMVGQVAVVMQELDNLFSGTRATFDASTSTRAYRIAATDYAQLLIVPHLHLMMARTAPKMSVHVTSLGESPVVDWLRSGTLDIAIGVFPDGVPNDLCHEVLFSDRFVGMAQLGHPVARGSVDLATYSRLHHVVVAGSSLREGVVDDVISHRSIRRRIAVAVPHFGLSPHLVASTRSVATFAMRIARMFSTSLPLRTFELPFELPSIELVMTWHRRVHDAPHHVWLRQMVVESTHLMRDIGGTKRVVHNPSTRAAPVAGADEEEEIALSDPETPPDSRSAASER